MRLIQAITPNHKVSAGQEERDRREMESWAERPFIDFLSSRDLSPRLISFVAYSIAGLDYHQTSPPSSCSSVSTSSTPSLSSPCQVTTREGVTRMRSHLLSLGRYGAGGHLYPIYSMGELPQAFARLSAVHGGVFILRFAPLALVVEGERERGRRVKGIITAGGQMIQADTVVTDWDYVVGMEGGREEGGMVSCGVCVLDGAIVQGGGAGGVVEPLSQIVFPPFTCGNPHPIRLLQLTDSVKAAPPSLTLLHLYTPSTGTAEEDLRPVLRYLTHDSTWAPPPSTSHQRPVLLQAMFHQRKVRKGILPSSSTTTASASLGSVREWGGYSNVYVSGDSSPLQDLDAHVEEAAAMLRSICPGVELMTAMQAIRGVGRGEDEEKEGEMEELNVLNSVLAMDERKEGEGKEEDGEGMLVVVPTIVERETKSAYEDEDGVREQKTASTGGTESAILDSLDDLTFE